MNSNFSLWADLDAHLQEMNLSWAVCGGWVIDSHLGKHKNTLDF
ncbi:hypothetical protein [Anaerosolibacter sp.]